MTSKLRADVSESPVVAAAVFEVCGKTTGTTRERKAAHLMQPQNRQEVSKYPLLGTSPNDLIFPTGLTLKIPPSPQHHPKALAHGPVEAT